LIIGVNTRCSALPCASCMMLRREMIVKVIDATIIKTVIIHVQGIWGLLDS